MSLTTPAASVARGAVGTDFGEGSVEGVEVYIASKALAALKEATGGDGGALEVQLDGQAVKLVHGRHLFWRAADVPR